MSRVKQNAVNGSEPERYCRFCGQGNIIRDMTASEAETNVELMAEASI